MAQYGCVGVGLKGRRRATPIAAHRPFVTSEQILSQFAQHEQIGNVATGGRIRNIRS